MDSQIISLIISWTVSLIAGGAGGTIVGALVKNRNLSPMLNAVLGLVGGGLGGKVLPMLIPAIGSLVGGTDSLVGTGGLSAIVGALLPLIAQAAAQINAPPSRTVKPATEREPIYLQAEEVVYDDERKIVSVVGNVEISDQGRTLMADRVEYDQTTDTITARG